MVPSLQSAYVPTEPATTITITSMERLSNYWVMKYSNYMYCVFLMDDAYYTYVYVCVPTTYVFCKSSLWKNN